MSKDSAVTYGPTCENAKPCSNEQWTKQNNIQTQAQQWVEAANEQQATKVHAQAEE
jgi:hypothetical protein